MIYHKLLPNLLQKRIWKNSWPTVGRFQLTDDRKNTNHPCRALF
jgi:hypothetical protein